MTENEKVLLKIASLLLEDASEKYSNHGCNDLSDAAIELGTPELCADISKYFGWVERGEDFMTDISGVGDDYLMKYLSHKFKEMAETKTSPEHFILKYLQSDNVTEQYFGLTHLSNFNMGLMEYASLDKTQQNILCETAVRYFNYMTSKLTEHKQK